MPTAKKDKNDNFITQQLVKNITDIHIKSYDIESSIVYPKQKITKGLMDFISGLLNKITLSVRETQDFQVIYKGVSFRGTSMKVTFGVLYTLRKTSILEQLSQFKAFKPLERILSSDSLNQGGIVMITGMPGNGKTTTGVNTVINRLKKHGGVCYTVEDPPEIPIEGEHGKGVCFQTDARDLKGIAPSIKNLLRAYPVNEKSMVFIGEIRDANTAEQALMAAVDGRLVITTMHAGSLINALDRFINLAASKMGRKSALSIASSAIKVCVNQKITDNKLIQDFFRNTEVITALINSDKIKQIVTDIERQKINYERKYKDCTLISD